MGRFLIFFSYVGTRYSGVQQQLHLLKHGRPVKTAGGVLEEALAALKPISSPKIQVSSRTDKGVHALRNSCHVDLQHPEAGREYDPAIVTNVANYNLCKNGEDVRVVETRRVPDNFHSRANAVGRKYVYRLAHVLSPGLSMCLSGLDQEKENADIYTELRKFIQRSKFPKLPIGSPVPILDQDKLYVCRTNLNMSKLLQAAALLSGVHDFTAFSNKHKTKEELRLPPHPVKLLTIGVKRGQPFGHLIHRCGQDVTQLENLEFWDIHVQSKSFLYKMVRRCVGGMILAATDTITLADLQEVLDNPRRDFPFTSRLSFSEDGLFLADVIYKPEDLMLYESDQESTRSDNLNVEERKPFLETDGITNCSPIVSLQDRGTFDTDPVQADYSNPSAENNDLLDLTKNERFDR